MRIVTNLEPVHMLYYHIPSQKLKVDNTSFFLLHKDCTDISFLCLSHCFIYTFYFTLIKCAPPFLYTWQCSLCTAMPFFSMFFNFIPHTWVLSPLIYNIMLLHPIQLIYDFKDGGGSLDLISLLPDELSKQDKVKFSKIGVQISSMRQAVTIGHSIQCAHNIHIFLSILAGICIPEHGWIHTYLEPSMFLSSTVDFLQLMKDSTYLPLITH